MVAKWADSGAPRGNPGRHAAGARLGRRRDVAHWHARPDRQDQEHRREGQLARLVGEIEPVPIPLDEDRYVLAVEIKEVNDATVHNGGRDTVGGLFVAPPHLPHAGRSRHDRRHGGAR